MRVLTIKQAKALVEYMLGGQEGGGDENPHSKPHAPLLRAMLDGLIPSGCPTEYQISQGMLPVKEWMTGQALLIQQNYQKQRDEFCEVLERLAEVLRRGEEQVQLSAERYPVYQVGVDNVPQERRFKNFDFYAEVSIHGDIGLMFTKPLTIERLPQLAGLVWKLQEALAPGVEPREFDDRDHTGPGASGVPHET